jgi:2-dehydro-3-deoxyphosphogalactonate aldolase
MALRDWLQRCDLVAILRGVTPEEVLPIGEALAEAGFAVLEVPLNSPRPVESIRKLVAHFGDRLLVGAGTVMTPAQVATVADAGGKLVVLPHASEAVVRAAKARGMVAVPGFFTPTEAFAMLAAGADGLKLFPAEAASPAVLKAMRAVLPANTLVLPVGGIDAGNIPAWRAAGAAGFGIGSSIYKPGDTPEIVAAKAQALLSAGPLRAA